LTSFKISLDSRIFLGAGVILRWTALEAIEPAVTADFIADIVWLEYAVATIHAWSKGYTNVRREPIVFGRVVVINHRRLFPQLFKRSSASRE